MTFNVHTFDNNLFLYCMEFISEFPEFITGYDDFVESCPTNFVTDLLEERRMDFLFKRENGNFVDFEHHSTINSKLFLRDGGYIMESRIRLSSIVELAIMYTGNHIVKEFYDESGITVRPIFFNCMKINASKVLNNIKIKLDNNKKLSPNDYICLMWYPRFKNPLPVEEAIIQLVNIASRMNSDEYFNVHLKRVVVGWYARYLVKDVNNEKYNKKLSEVKRMLNVELDSVSIGLVNSGLEERRKELFEKYVNASDEEKAVLNDENVNMRKELASVNDENVNMRRDLASVNDENVNLRRDLASVNDENVNLRRELASVNEKNDELTKKYVNLLSMLKSMGIVDVDLNQ